MPGQLRTIPLAIAAEGLTVDGREISEKDINDIVETFSAEEYGARINIDHYADWSGYKAEVFSSIKLNGGMLGDVLSVSAEKNDKGVLLLKAVLAPNASFVLLNQADQHVYFSIEIDRDFCETGKTYLTGLAVTDYPASRYTTRAEFSKERAKDNKDVSFLRVDFGIKQEATEPQPKPSFLKNLFNTSQDTTMDETKLANAISQGMSGSFTQLGDQLTEQFKTINEKLDTFQSNGGQDDNHTDETNEQTEALTQLTEKLDKQTEQFAQLKEQFEKLSNKEANDTTDADDEPTGENAQYKVL